MASKRAPPAKQGQIVKLVTNFFPIRMISDKLYKYNLIFDPEPAQQAQNERRLVYQKSRQQLEPVIGKSSFANTMCFASQYVDKHTVQVAVQIQGETKNYTLKLQNVGQVDQLQYKAFVNRLFNNLQKVNGLQMLGRKFFDPKYGKKIEQHRVEVWPGYSSSIGRLQVGMLLQIDLSNRVLRLDTVLSQLVQISQECQRSGADITSQAKKKLIGQIVLTRYNNKTYPIQDIDFNSNPQSTFESQRGNMSYLEYYRDRWQQNISDIEQPLLVSKQAWQTTSCYLIPELCYMTGLSDEQIADFNFMKSLSAITRKEPAERIAQCQKLINDLQKEAKTAQIMKEWSLEINTQPFQVDGLILQKPKILTAKQNFTPDEGGNFDRSVQTNLFNAKELTTWGIMYPGNEHQTYEMFSKTIQECIKTFEYPCQEPAVFKINSNSIADWESKIREVVFKDVQCLVFILPGQKGKAHLYRPLKHLLTTEIPVPSQVILAQTIKKGKGLRSICNKVLVQICAKVGGEPWVVAELPFTEVPTMVVGIDVFHKIGRLSCLGITAS